MPSLILNYILCFIAGTAFALVGVSIVGGIPPGNYAQVLKGMAGLFPALHLGRDSLVLAALFLLVATLLALCWTEAVALANQVLRRSPASALRPATHATGVLPGEQRDGGGREVRAVRDELERQLGRLIVLIADQLENSKDHVAALKDTNNQLASVTSTSELHTVLQSLISKNETNVRQTGDLEERLKDAQDQASELRKRLVQAEKLASLDPLTSIANRRRFEQFISAEVDRSHASGTPLCLIMTDIDHFKKVNDTHGHSAGDRVLKAFADLLAANVRDCDLVARYGGEEFAIVLPQTPMGDAYGIAEKMRRRIERKGGPGKTALNEFGRLTASFGVAEIRDGEPPSALIQRADQKLYEAKSKGRNRTMVWSSSPKIREDA